MEVGRAYRCVTVTATYATVNCYTFRIRRGTSRNANLGFDVTRCVKNARVSRWRLHTSLLADEHDQTAAAFGVYERSSCYDDDRLYP
jgi:hypothetical protein